MCSGGSCGPINCIKSENAVVFWSVVGPLICAGESSGVLSSGNGVAVFKSIFLLGVWMTVYLSSRCCIVATCWGVIPLVCTPGASLGVLGEQGSFRAVSMVIVPIVLCCFFVCVMLFLVVCVVLFVSDCGVSVCSGGWTVTLHSLLVLFVFVCVSVVTLSCVMLGRLCSFVCVVIVCVSVVTLFCVVFGCVVVVVVSFLFMSSSRRARIWAFAWSMVSSLRRGKSLLVHLAAISKVSVRSGGGVVGRSSRAFSSCSL